MLYMQLVIKTAYDVIVWTHVDSIDIRYSLLTLPNAKSPIDPSFLTALWHGIRRGIGFNLQAVPTALAAPGNPILEASDEYDSV